MMKALNVPKAILNISPIIKWYYISSEAPTSADYPELGATSAREAVDQEVLSARVV